MNIQEIDFNDVVEKYSDVIYKIALIHTHKHADAQDIVQDTFMKYVIQIRNKGNFETEEYTRAWLIRVAINKCIDINKSWISKFSELTELNGPVVNFSEDENENEVLQAIRKLPEKYKDVVYLFYVEGYSIADISELINKNQNTVKTHLSRGRNALKKMLREEFEYAV